MNPCWGENWNGIKTWLHWQSQPGLFWGQRAAHAGLSLPNAAEREGNGKNPGKKRLERPKPCISVGKSNWNLPKCILRFPQALVGSAGGPKLHSGSLWLISKLTAWSQLSRGLRSSRSTIPLFFPFIVKSSTQGSIGFQTTRGPRTELQTGKKSAGLGASCVGQEFHKNSSLKITPKGKIYFMTVQKLLFCKSSLGQN